MSNQNLAATQESPSTDKPAEKPAVGPTVEQPAKEESEKTPAAVEPAPKV